MMKQEKLENLKETLDNLIKKLSVNNHDETQFKKTANQLIEEFPKLPNLFALNNDNVNYLISLKDRIIKVYNQYIPVNYYNRPNSLDLLSETTRQFLVAMENIAEESYLSEKKLCEQIYICCVECVDVMIKRGKVAPKSWQKIQRFYHNRIKECNQNHTVPKKTHSSWYYAVIIGSVFLVFTFFFSGSSDSGSKWDDLDEDEQEWIIDNYGDGKAEEYNEAIDDYRSSN